MLHLPAILVFLLSVVTHVPHGTEVLGAHIPVVQEDSKFVEGTQKSIKPAEEGEFFEGDIILKQYKALNENGGDFKNLVVNGNLLWPGKTLYYQLSNEFSEADKSWIRAAIMDLQSVTCVKFEESPGSGAYMLVKNSNGCAAPVGYQGIRTDMFLSSSGCRTLGTIQHEFLHALGFWHEHTRPDRDSYVQIMWDNIRPGSAKNFQARTPGESQSEGMPYDYGSVMHYRAVAFSRDGSPTIVPLQRGAQIGQRFRYSLIDLAKLNRLYGCSERYYLGKDLYQGVEEIEASVLGVPKEMEEGKVEKKEKMEKVMNKKIEEMGEKEELDKNAHENQSKVKDGFETTNVGENEGKKASLEKESE